MFKFDPKNWLLVVDPEQVRPDGTLVIDAVKDVYGESREWEASVEGIVFDEVVTGTGGVVLPSGIRTDIHVILNGDWRIQPPDNAQSILLLGNLHRHDNTDPFAPRPDGKTALVEQSTREGLAKRKLLHWAAIIFVVIGLLLFVLWMVTDPTEIEPYATFFVVLATLVQLLRNGFPK